jgi:hypothetical protein
MPLLLNSDAMNLNKILLFRNRLFSAKCCQIADTTVYSTAV